MPKLPPFALADTPAVARNRTYHLVLLFAVCAIMLLSLHMPLLNLPFYWDEQGQFIPTALDLLRTGAWVAHSTIPNVHPPGVEVYLVAWYKLFGFSIVVTRVAMLVFAAAGLLFTFLLAIELSRDTGGAPAFLPPLFLIASPLFFTQSMMAQLDMPAMVLSILATLLFVKSRYTAALITCLVLVLVKETGLVVPATFSLMLLLRREWRRALLFLVPVLPVAGWLLFLHSKTGFWMGDPGFAHYNIDYALNPVRVLFSLLRRIYYLFFGEFRWLGTLVLVLTARKCSAFRTWRWQVAFAVGGFTVVLVSVLGGAELERYVLPVLPIFYIAVSVGLTLLPRRIAMGITATLLLGLACNLFWNPPYPFPYENNYAAVDFVKLQQAAAAFTEQTLAGKTIATAWPFSAALRSTDYGFVSRRLKVIETGDFHPAAMQALRTKKFDVLITYTRTWKPKSKLLATPVVQKFLARYYEWKPDITPAECEAEGLEPEASWTRGGQQITVYVRTRQDF